MGNSASKTPSPHLSDLLQRGLVSTNIGEKIAIAFALLQELKSVPAKNFRKQVRERFFSLNNEMYSLLHLIKDYVHEYGADYEALSQLQEQWRPEEVREKTANFLLSGSPSFLFRIAESTKEFHVKLSTLLIEIRRLKDECDQFGTKWTFIGVGVVFLILAVVAVTVPFLIPLEIGIAVACYSGGGVSGLSGVALTTHNHRISKDLKEYQQYLEESITMWSQVLTELDPMVDDHVNAIRVIETLNNHGGDFVLGNATTMCNTFASLRAAFRTAVAETTPVPTSDNAIAVASVINEVCASSVSMATTPEAQSLLSLIY